MRSSCFTRNAGKPLDEEFKKDIIEDLAHNKFDLTILLDEDFDTHSYHFFDFYEFAENYVLTNVDINSIPNPDVVAYLTMVKEKKIEECPIVKPNCEEDDIIKHSLYAPNFFASAVKFSIHLTYLYNCLFNRVINASKKGWYVDTTATAFGLTPDQFFCLAFYPHIRDKVKFFSDRYRMSPATK